MPLQMRRIRLEKIEARWTEKITRRKIRRAITETLAKWHLGAACFPSRMNAFMGSRCRCAPTRRRGR